MNLSGITALQKYVERIHLIHVEILLLIRFAFFFACLLLILLHLLASVVRLFAVIIFLVAFWKIWPVYFVFLRLTLFQLQFERR